MIAGEIPLEYYEANFSAGGKLVRCYPSSPSPAIPFAFNVTQSYRSIRNSSRNEPNQSYCVNVPGVKIR